MKNLIEQLQLAEPNFNSIDLIMHIGAGRCKELSLYRRLKPKSLYLIEANPSFVNELRIRTMPDQGEHVIHRVVSDIQADEVTLYLCNNQNEHSIARLTTLLDFFPNLAITNELNVKNSKLSSILEECEFDESKKNMLVIETAGCEYGILRSVSVKTLQGFSWIVMRIGKQILHEGGTSFAIMEEFLVNNGFTYRYQNLETVEPYLEVAFCRDERQIEILNLRAALNIFKQKVTTQNEILVDLEQKRIELTNVLVELSELRDQHSNLKLELQQLQESAAFDQKKVKQLDSMLKEVNTKYIHLENQLASERKQNKNIRSEALSLQEQLNQHDEINNAEIAQLKANIESARNEATNERSFTEKLRVENIIAQQNLEQLKIQNEELKLQVETQAQQSSELKQLLVAAQSEQMQTNASLKKAETQVALIQGLLLENE